MNYTEVALTVAPDFADIITAELGHLGYESFVETDAGLNAYIPEPDFDAVALRLLTEKYADQTAIAYQFTTLEKRNWNAEWEQSYQPIEVGKPATGVRVRASFHGADVGFRYDIVVNPKMSFGTGHHETTYMMLQHQLGLNHNDLRVLDVGCGTGILAIMAAKAGAKSVLAFDVEEWAVENSRENAALNHCAQIEVFQGTIADVKPTDSFGMILANINRNVLLADISAYTALLTVGGPLVVSGFYEHDAPDIIQTATNAGLILRQTLTRNQWTSLHFEKHIP
jgi:ribosomal protein L11 methyltransferase